MTGSDARILTRGEKLSQLGALAFLLFLGGMALAGPSGILSWSENLSVLEQRQAEISKLTAERDVLRHRVALLDPKHADRDLAGELVRSRLNVLRPDEVVILLNKPDR